MKVSGIIFDFNRTLYDPDTGKLIEGVVGLLENLKLLGYKLSLICKKSVSDRAELISSLGLDKFFCSVLVIEGNKRIGHFQDCLASMRLNISEVLVVGDRVEEEISVGNQMGIVTVWFKQGKFGVIEPMTKLQLPTYVVHDLREILEIVRR